MRYNDNSITSCRDEKIHPLSATSEQYPELIKTSFSCVIFSLMCLSGSVALAQLPPDHLGNYLGCQEDPETSPYCSDPEIRRFVYEQFSILNWFDEYEFDDINRAIVVGALLRAVRNSMRHPVVVCGDDVQCIISVLSEATAEMREISEVPADPLTEDEIAVFAAAEEEMAASIPDMRQQLRELDELYESEWQAAESVLDDGALGLLRFRYERPDQWTQNWNRRCGDGVSCLDGKESSLEEMTSWLDGRVTGAQALRRENEIRENRARRDALAAAAEERRQEESQARQEAANAEASDALAAEASEALAADSMLYHVLLGDFQAADSVAARIAEQDFYEPMYGGFSALIGNSQGNSLREGVINNRRNIVVAAYGLTRLDILGDCGESVETVSWQKTEEVTWRNAFGVEVRRSPGQFANVTIPATFARHVRDSGLENGRDIFSREVRAIGGCDSNLRRMIERQLIAFANWRPL